MSEEGCIRCGGKRAELKGKMMPEGFEYRYWRCKDCGEEVVDMEQLHELADKYREMKKHRAKLTKWGLSVGLRLPKDIVNKYFRGKSEVNIIPEKKGIRIIPVS